MALRRYKVIPGREEPKKFTLWLHGPPIPGDGGGPTTVAWALGDEYGDFIAGGHELIKKNCKSLDAMRWRSLELAIWWLREDGRCEGSVLKIFGTELFIKQLTGFEKCEGSQHTRMLRCRKRLNELGLKQWSGAWVVYKRRSQRNQKRAAG